MRNHPESTSPIIRLTKNRHLYRIVLMVAVILVIISTTSIKSNGSSSNTAKVERDVGVVIFLALTALQAFQTLILAKLEISSRSPKRD